MTVHIPEGFDWFKDRKRAENIYLKCKTLSECQHNLLHKTRDHARVDAIPVFSSVEAIPVFRLVEVIPVFRFHLPCRSYASFPKTVNLRVEGIPVFQVSKLFQFFNLSKLFHDPAIASYIPVYTQNVN